MSQALIFTAPGAPLQTEQFADSPLQGAEVRVRVTCCTLCRSDLHTHAGRRTEPTPTVLGHEIVGQIESFGPEAPRVDFLGAAVEPGSRITWAIAVGCGACFFCADNLPQKCEHLLKYGHRRITEDAPPFGGLTESLILAPGTAWFRVPDALSDAVAAPANCATATVAAALRAAGSVADKSVLILGAGVLGVTACAMADAAGASVVLASDPDPECQERARRFGASQVFSADPATLAEGVAAATQGRGVDIVLEMSGARSAVIAAIDLARVGGTVILAGAVTPVDSIPLFPEQIVRRLLTIRGVHNYHPQDLATALAFLAGPGLRYPFESLVVNHYPLSEAEAAFTFAHAHPGLRVAILP